MRQVNKISFNNTTVNFQDVVFSHIQMKVDQINVMLLCCVRLGRRRSLIAFYALSGIALLLSQVIPEQ